MKEINVHSHISEFKGVGKAREAALGRLSIHTAGDLLYCFPRSYEHRGDIHKLNTPADNAPHAYMLKVITAPRTVKTGRGYMVTSFRAGDDTGSCEIVYFNQSYMGKAFEVGSEYRFWGYLKWKSGRLIMSSPRFEPRPVSGRLADYLPVYSLTEGLSQKILTGLIDSAIDEVLPTLKDFLPDNIVKKHQLLPLSQAIESIHRPSTEADLSAAARRLMFDDFLCFALGVAKSKSDNESLTTLPCRNVDMSKFTALLPYSLTNAQNRCIDEICRDITDTDEHGECRIMRRVLVGDVGSGKTVCAAMAIYAMLANGHQAAMMVPTEILAQQHYSELEPMFSSLGYRTVLLTGSTPQKEKQRIYTLLKSEADDRIDLVIGTHALLNVNVEFSDLMLTVTDEQHRFGIMQRAGLKGKARHSHLLVMSATPIPRTLALSMYGDLAVSKIDEMPRGRQRVDTFKVDDSYRARLMGFIRKQVADGGQVYIVCPTIEAKESTADDEPDIDMSMDLMDILSLFKDKDPPLKNAVDYVRELRKETFPELRIELMHGKMTPAEKDDVMSRFGKGEVDILVSTTVIEVGVNVPNACLMIVENAERFGLSQLHQLRGRVGRGSRKSYCILVSDSKSESASERLKTMCECYDGFQIAEKDLMQRGPGDFFASSDDNATRQSGASSLRIGKYCQDASVMTSAFQCAREIISADPRLKDPENYMLLEEISRVFKLDELTIS